MECWHNYTATGGPTVCVPFMVTNYGYGIIWDNPSKTVIEPGFNEQTRWTSEVGDRVSFFVIAGNTFNEIYSGYRPLTGATPLLPKAAYGYIQCKQRYSSRMNCWPWPGDIASAICPPISWWWTGSITQKWARWILFRKSGLIQPP